MKSFDPTLKHLVEASPADWLALLNESAASVEVIDADIATVSGAADKVLRVQSDPNWLLHLEFHAGHDGAELPPTLHARNALLFKRHRLVAETLVVVLKPDADSPQLSGVLTCQRPNRPRPNVLFEYEVRRVWQLNPDLLLQGGLGTMPLAPISNVTEADVSDIIQKMEARLKKRRTQESVRREIWSATFLLLGLRYSPEVATQLLRGVRNMKESSTYQAILKEGYEAGLSQGQQMGREEGRLQEARQLLIELGTPHLGEPDATATAAIHAITDRARLHALIARVQTAATWNELLGTPPTPSKRRRRS